MRKIKVLHVSPNSVINGAERHILSIVSCCNRDIIESWVATPTRGIMNDHLDKINIKSEIAGRIHGYKYSGFFKKNGLFNLIKLIRREKFDIVHSHLNSYACLIAKMLGVKYTIHTRHGIFWTKEGLENMSFILKKFQKLKSKKIDVTIALSLMEEETMIKNFGYEKKKIRKIYNGVSIKGIEDNIDRKLTKKDLFDTDDFIIGAVGRLEKQKNFSLLLDVAADVLRKINNVKFIVLGDGSLKSELENKMKNLNLNNKFEFLGYKENIYNYINHFDLMIQTSLWEGMPYVLLEAMALGKTIVTTTSKELSGVNEVVVDGETGYLVNDNYQERLIILLLSLLDNKDKLSEFGKNAKKRIEKNFTEENMVTETEKIYIELLNN